MPMRQTVAKRSALSAAGLALVLAAGPAPANDAGTDGISQCEAGAWTTDTDPAGLNIRSGPGTGYPIIGTIPPPMELSNGTFASEVSITGSKDGWFRIGWASFFNYDTDEDILHFEGEGWVSGRHLAFAVEARELRGGPSVDSPVTFDFSEGRSEEESDPYFFEIERLLGCEGHWVEMEGMFHGEPARGWAADICPSQVTTCP